LDRLKTAGEEQPTGATTSVAPESTEHDTALAPGALNDHEGVVSDETDVGPPVMVGVAGGVRSRVNVVEAGALTFPAASLATAVRV
jgi:hypothetical protein